MPLNNDRFAEGLRQGSAEDLHRVLELVTNNLADGVVVADLEGRFLLFNPAAQAILGIGATETAPAQWASQYGLFLPDKTTPFAQDQIPLVRATRGESVNDVEMFIRNPQRQEGLFINVYARPLKDELGNLAGGIAVFRDVTEKRTAAEEICRLNEKLESQVRLVQSEYQKSLSVLQATLESTTDGILVVDCQGIVLSHNNKFLEMWNVPPGTLFNGVDQVVLSFTLQQIADAEGFLNRIQQIYMDPGCESYDLVHFKNGKVFERYSQPQRINQQIVGRVWSFRDITDRRRADEASLLRTEKALRYQAGLLEMVKLEMADLETALKSILEVDAKTLGAERVSIWLFDAEKTEIECQWLYRLSDHLFEAGQVLSARDYPAYFRALEESRILPASHAVVDSRTREFAENYLKPNRISSMMDVPFRVGGKVIGIICHEHIGEERDWSLEDQEFASSVADLISLAYTAAERRKAEKALKQKTEELERSNKELEQFAYVASHDLQEPLHLVIAFASRMDEIYRNVLDEKGLDYLNRMKRSAYRMRQLIDDLLQFSRVTTRARPFTRVDLKHLLGEILVDLELRLVETGGTVETESLPVVFADSFQIRQLFQNLLSNALKFQAKGDIPKIRIGSRPAEEGFCEIEVEDNGIGFDEKYLEQIFMPFSRLHSYFEYEGSGIGLAVCQKIVSRHGGRIGARSRPGKGATFIFTLPLTEPVT